MSDHPIGPSSQDGSQAPGPFDRYLAFLERPATVLSLGLLAVVSGVVLVVLRVVWVDGLVDAGEEGVELRLIPVAAGLVAMQGGLRGRAKDREAGRRVPRTREVGWILGVVGFLLGIALFVVGIAGLLISLAS